MPAVLGEHVKPDASYSEGGGPEGVVRDESIEQKRDADDEHVVDEHLHHHHH